MTPKKAVMLVITSLFNDNTGQHFDNSITLFSFFDFLWVKVLIDNAANIKHTIESGLSILHLRLYRIIFFQFFSTLFNWYRIFQPLSLFRVLAAVWWWRWYRPRQWSVRCTIEKKEEVKKKVVTDKNKYFASDMVKKHFTPKSEKHHFLLSCFIVIMVCLVVLFFLFCLALECFFGFLSISSHSLGGWVTLNWSI